MVAVERDELERESWREREMSWGRNGRGTHINVREGDGVGAALGPRADHSGGQEVARVGWGRVEWGGFIFW